MSETCTRCGGNVPSILSGPPPEQDIPARPLGFSWWRNQILMTRREVTYTMTVRIFTRKWLPERAADRVREMHTTLALCDHCATDVAMFAQNLPLVWNTDLAPAEVPR